MRGSGERSWFGPKRIGVGLRPQTWQGWLVVLVICAAIVAGGILVTH
jgi:hypothetical protein